MAHMPDRHRRAAGPQADEIADIKRHHVILMRSNMVVSPVTHGLDANAGFDAEPDRNLKPDRNDLESGQHCSSIMHSLL